MADNQPIKYLDSEAEGAVLCQRCKNEKALLVSRKEPFCKNCFIRFIRGKQRKQMQDDKYKVKYGALIEKLGVQKILLTLSGGPSSLVLLDVMASLLKEQFEGHNGKQGFELVVLNIEEFEIQALNKRLDQLLPQILSLYAPIKITYKVLSLSSYILDQEMLEKILINKEFTGFSSPAPKAEHRLEDLLALCPNKSSAEDLLTIVYDELILRTAYIESCQTILYGHSMTRIANEIIALTCKGRGSTIYKAVADHSINFRDNEYKILFPLRDVLYSEVLAYSKLSGLDAYRVESTIKKSKITKNLTIRDLTTNYFATLDATGYASTASTVVKTGEKLGAPKDSVIAHCQICGVEIYQDPRGWLRKITVNEAAPIDTEEEKDYAKQYEATFGTEYIPDEQNPVHICYGCIVTIGGVKQDGGFVWPVKRGEYEGEIKNTYINSEDQAVLDEYILTDDEE
ncbi:cytoplasmic tRNA 2-thiolation protein 2 [Suhomyces tanzawaensis NRRL Y-17324]|uniref:Cytoplasmic tRNA 2-thiolation protein 2 n=1 Tax=Suhomyces tanzawaensis NRRL Y-17324 TaxID=984487 RepID=A0A1E4SK67_9ASCO|nr:cytoplasmic tRNA 2-thiolation protein 2 [Suhomyces tanzawaensis NRRL Y-17324]ODV79901.1 cytoplasmic tRNA 2-thiolation protein 2 [Suhomyces tanzawaensis NRRL Y-17324]